MRSARYFQAPLPEQADHFGEMCKTEDEAGESIIKHEDEEGKSFNFAEVRRYSRTDSRVSDEESRLATEDNSFIATRIDNVIGYALTDLSRRRAIEGLPVDQEAMSLYQTAFASKISQFANWRQQLSLGPYSAMSKIGALATDDTFEIYPGELQVHVIALPMSNEEIQKMPGTIEHIEFETLKNGNSVWLTGRLDFLLDTKEMFAEVHMSEGSTQKLPENADSPAVPSQTLG